jgi:hypothetical protein
MAALAAMAVATSREMNKPRRKAGACSEQKSREEMT